MSKSLNLYGASAIGAVALLTGAYNFADRNVAPMPETVATLGAAPEAPESMFIAAALATPTPSDGPFGLGRTALPDEIAAWDGDVAPDGTGLPVGSGDAIVGEELFSEHCAICHGEFAEGVDNWPKLAGGDDSLADEDPLKTVGSYWPYLSTVFDYVHRSMPYGNAQSLSADDTYAIVAYILYSNYLIDDDFVLSNETFLDVEMPNADGFIIDDRAETEYTIFTTENACFENCKDSVEVTMRASVLDVTPDEEGAEEEAAADMEEVNDSAAAPEPAMDEAAAEAEPAVQMAAFDPELAKDGEKVFKKCKACHQVGEGAKNKTGPMLNGVVGRQMAAVEGFRYGKANAAMGAEGMVWDEANLTAFLAKPKDFMKGTKMSFAGLRKEDDIKAVIEYLKSFQ